MEQPVYGVVHKGRPQNLLIFLPLPTVRRCTHLTPPLPSRTSAFNIIHCTTVLQSVVKLLAQRCRVSKCLQMKTLSLFGESITYTRNSNKRQNARNTTNHLSCKNKHLKETKIL